MPRPDPRGRRGGGLASGRLAATAFGRRARTSGLAIGLLAGAMLALGCASDGARHSGEALDEPSLHPASAGATRSIPGPELSSLAPGRVFPAGDMQSRMRFLEAIDHCGRSRDEGARADARAFREVFESSEDAAGFLAALGARFTVWESVPALAGAKAQDGLVTGYATPVVRAQRRADARFRYPLFVDLRRRFPEIAEASRRTILATAGVDSQAIAWVSDPLAWALIETNGSARLLFEDGVEPAEICISRIATNGRPWTGMGRWFAENGLIDKPNYTLADVRTTAYVHPDKAEMAALANERVVYFAIADPARFPTTVGLPGGRLLAGWSCAADQSVYPPGSILLVVEDTESGPAAHLLFVHDSGGAIAGPQRIDCYLGEGDAALTRAGDLRGSARIYRLRASSGAD